jgi:hypothetical protein
MRTTREAILVPIPLEYVSSESCGLEMGHVQ